MRPDELQYPAIWFREVAYYLTRGEQHNGSYFGGPTEWEIIGAPEAQLHHIAQIGGHCFPPLFQRVGGGDLRLVFGMQHVGCELAYVAGRNRIEILKLSPGTPSLDWPYRDYPRHLPYFPLALAREVPCSIEEFSDASCQPLKATKNEAIVLVPPSAVLGVSLWGPSGDMEGVQIVYVCDLESGKIKATTQCG